MPILPEDIYYVIIDHLVPDWYAIEPDERLSYLLVSRQWRALCERSIYRAIHLRDARPPSRYSTIRACTLRSFLRTLSATPYIREMVRSMEVVLRISDQTGSQMTSRVLELCQRCERVSLQADWDFAPILEAVSKLPALKSLSLLGVQDTRSIPRGPDLKKVFERFASKSLDFLHLDAYQIRTDDNGGNSFTPWDDSDLYEELPQSQHRIANIKSLKLSNVREPGVGVKALLCWVAHLQELTLTDFALKDGYYCPFTLLYLDRIFKNNCDSLRSLEIDPGNGGQPSYNWPDLAVLPALERLNLAANYAVAGDARFLCEGLGNTSKLRYLNLNFKRPVLFDRSGRRERSLDQWLCQFVETLGFFYPSCALREIHLEFYPHRRDYCIADVSRRTTSKWPWEYHEKTTGFAASHGFRLTSSEPTMPQAEWMMKAHPRVLVNSYLYD